MIKSNIDMLIDAMHKLRRITAESHKQYITYCRQSPKTYGKQLEIIDETLENLNKNFIYQRANGLLYCPRRAGFAMHKLRRITSESHQQYLKYCRQSPKTYRKQLEIIDEALANLNKNFPILIKN